MSTDLVRTVTDRQLRDERDALLQRIGMSEEEVLRRGEAWTLESEEQWRAFGRLEDIRFLLGCDD